MVGVWFGCGSALLRVWLGCAYFFFVHSPSFLPIPQFDPILKSQCQDLWVCVCLHVRVCMCACACVCACVLHVYLAGVALTSGIYQPSFMALDPGGGVVITCNHLVRRLLNGTLSTLAGNGFVTAGTFDGLVSY